MVDTTGFEVLLGIFLETQDECDDVFTHTIKMLNFINKEKEKAKLSYVYPYICIMLDNVENEIETLFQEEKITYLQKKKFLNLKQNIKL